MVQYKFNVTGGENSLEMSLKGFIKDIAKCTEVHVIHTVLPTKSKIFHTVTEGIIPQPVVGPPLVDRIFSINL